MVGNTQIGAESVREEGDFYFYTIAGREFKIWKHSVKNVSQQKKEQRGKQKQTKEQPAPMAPVKQKQSPAVKFLMGMLESGRVDPEYTGFSITEVIDAIEKITGVKKGDFESTADYNARRSAALATKFFGDSSIEDLFTFMVPVSKIGEHGLRYTFNADTGDVNLYVLPKSSKYLIGAPDRELDMFALSSKIEEMSTYIGSNPYGTTVPVNKISKSCFGIASNRLPFKSNETYSDPTIASQFKLKNSRAEQELPALKALIIMKLANPPYVFHNFSIMEPKLNAPIDNLSSMSLIILSIT